MRQPHDKTVFDPAPAASRFAVWLALLIASLVAILYNFTLLAGPMGEFVGDNSRIFGDMSVASVGAGVIVCLEIFSGLFFLESRGVTTMFPVIHALPADIRQKLGYIFMFQLIMFASIQAGLVWMAGLLNEQAEGFTVFDSTDHMLFTAHMGVAIAIPFLFMLGSLSVDRIVHILRGQPT